MLTLWYLFQLSTLATPPAPPVCTRTGKCSKCGLYHPQRLDARRRYVYDPVCAEDKKDIVVILFIGDSGTGVGSPIGGVERWGGKKLRQHHMRSATVCLTSEFRTSKTCSMCLWRIRLAKAVRIVEGKKRWKSINGAVELLNKNCPSVRAGCCVKSRDGNAAMNIGMAVTSVLCAKVAGSSASSQEF
jgi:hypothetical protein